jgi:hypothetical protein
VGATKLGIAMLVPVLVELVVLDVVLLVELVVLDVVDDVVPPPEPPDPVELSEPQAASAPASETATATKASVLIDLMRCPPKFAGARSARRSASCGDPPAAAGCVRRAALAIRFAHPLDARRA